MNDKCTSLGILPYLISMIKTYRTICMNCTRRIHKILPLIVSLWNQFITLFTDVRDRHTTFFMSKFSKRNYHRRNKIIRWKTAHIAP